MWDNILMINSLLWAVSGVFLVYAFGTAVITWTWKQFVIALIIFVFFSIAELVITAILEP